MTAALRVSIDSSRNMDNAYEQYLLLHSKIAGQAIRAFEEKLHHSYLKYGRFTIPTFYKQHFVTRKQYHVLHSVCGPLQRIIDRVVNLYLNEPMVRQACPLSPEAA